MIHPDLHLHLLRQDQALLDVHNERLARWAEANQRHPDTTSGAADHRLRPVRAWRTLKHASRR